VVNEWGKVEVGSTVGVIVVHGHGGGVRFDMLGAEMAERPPRNSALGITSQPPRFANPKPRMDGS
jgi:hypothetical protein